MIRFRIGLLGWVLIALLGCTRQIETPEIGLTIEETEEGGYVGTPVCAGCHQQEYQLWKGSQHDLAMQPASAQTVLGNFNNSVFEHYGEETRFSRDGNDFLVTTTSANGESQSYKVAYTFGVYPLQQYLIPTENGQIQALSVSWDSRPKAQGGQRWFHLYPNEAIPAGDSLHWTGPYQNWNSRCADCHSTGFQRGYNAETDSYQSHWAEIDVACEACHGPGEPHVSAVRAGKPGSASLISLAQTRQWIRGPTQATAHPVPGLGTRAGSDWHPQLDRCGSCHSRRSLLDDPGKPGAFHQRHALSLISEPMYYADGQVRDEDYVLGSFLQSKMHQRGVVCSNCHEPHSLKLRAEGNALCGQCHNPAVFDRPEHHRHTAESDGAQCVNCHMPTTTYMVVDPRRDHSLRIPRPDLSAEFATPNACNQCHQDQSAQWAAETLNRWLGEQGRVLPENYSEQLLRGLRSGSSGEETLLRLARNQGAPDIVRASALQGARYGTEPAFHTARGLLAHDSAILRAAAVDQMGVLPMSRRLQILAPLLADPSKQVRTAVAWQLKVATDAELSQFTTEAQRGQWQTLMNEYQHTLKIEQYTPSGQVALGDWNVSRGEYQQAIAYYEKALQKVPELSPAALNLADLYRGLNQDAQGEAVLRKAITHNPRNPALQHALGLNLIRQRRYNDAVTFLKRTTKLAPGEERYGYVYGTLLQHLGKNDAALTEWQRVLSEAPQNRDVLLALLQLCRQEQNWALALNYAERLQQLMPGDGELARLVEHLRANQK